MDLPPEEVVAGAMQEAKEKLNVSPFSMSISVLTATEYDWQDPTHLNRQMLFTKQQNFASLWPQPVSLGFMICVGNCEQQSLHCYLTACLLHLNSLLSAVGLA